MFFSSAPQPSTGRGGAAGQRQRSGHVPARAPHEQRPPARHHSRNRVVGAGLDRAVVDEQQVGDRAQPLHGVLVAVGDRLVGHVAAGHHERAGAEVAQQQVVKRRVREHHAKLHGAGGNRLGDRGLCPARGEHDRPLRTAQQRAFSVPEIHEAFRLAKRPDHQRKRLVLAMLARPQRADRGLVVCPAGEVIPADPLDRDDRTAAQRVDRGR